METKRREMEKNRQQRHGKRKGKGADGGKAQRDVNRYSKHTGTHRI